MERDRRYRERSHWLDVLDEELTPRPSLPGDRDADVVVVGAGFTGLWTAYALVTASPELRVVVLEAEIAGFGASGRNGGFVSAGIAGEARVYERRGGLDAVVRAERAMIDGIDWIGDVVRSEGIDCGWAKGGSLRVATSRPQLARVKAGMAAKRRRGLTEEDSRLVSASEVRERVRLEGVLGGAYTPHCARVNPAALARGLARACEARGVVIHERSPATELGPGVASTPFGRVTAPFVVRATEAFTTRFPGHHRAFLPLASRMVATEPVPPDAWEEIGWERCETVADQHHHFVYLQRTPDGRIAVGGRGLAYRLGGRIDERDERDAGAAARLEDALRSLLPRACSLRFTHEWAGTFAAPRDWSMGVELDRGTGLVRAGGYSGHGVVASSLAGRTVADLVLGVESELTALPWVGHASPRWEPEPLRWLGAHSISAILASADRAEDRTGRPARRARLVARWTPGR